MPEPETSARRGLTRRQVLAGGTVVAGAVVAGGYGRYALGDQFEEHVAGVLGTSVDTAKHLLGIARERLGETEYDVKAAQFLAVTSFPGSELAPYRARNKGIGELVAVMGVDGSAEGLMLLGMQDGDAGPACAGLLKA